MTKAEFLQDLARSAGQIIKDRYHTSKTWRSKDGGGDIVTEVDEASEKYIISRIQQEYPNDNILSEECGAIDIGEDRATWIIDPLDGTRNYMMGIPFFCVSIGIVEKGSPIMGAIYDPIHDELFFAERGKDAFLNGERINVSKENSLSDSVISVSWVKRKVDRTKFIEYIEEISRETSYFRRFGSAALVMAYVACGRLHSYLQGGLCPWDVAAGVVLVEEAGGVVTDFQGKSIDLQNKEIEMLTANAELHSLLLCNVIGRCRK